MPTVLTSGGFRVMIYSPPREHGPPHVHVTRPGAEVRVALEPVRVREVSGMREADVVAAARIVERFQAFLLERWMIIHGQQTID